MLFPRRSVLLLQSTSADADPLVARLRRNGWEVIHRRIDETRQFVRESLQEWNSVPLWWIPPETLNNLVTHIAGAEHPIFDLAPILLTKEHSTRQTVAAFRAGATDLISEDDLEKELIPAVERAYSRRVHEALRTLRLVFRAIRDGIIEGTSRLLHDLTSPQTVIGNAMDLYEMQLEMEGTEPNSKLRMIRSGITSTERIVEHWKEFLVSEQSAIGVVDLAGALHLALRLLHAEQPSIELVTDPPELHPGSAVPHRPVPVVGTEVGLQQIFHELFSNSVHATRDANPPRLHVTLQDAGSEGIRVLIDDNGTGIPEEIRETFWKDFVRGENSAGPGLGIGLVRYLVMMFGAALALGESTLGGTCMVLTFQSGANRE